MNSIANIYNAEKEKEDANEGARGKRKEGVVIWQGEGMVKGAMGMRIRKERRRIEKGEMRRRQRTQEV